MHDIHNNAQPLPLLLLLLPSLPAEQLQHPLLPPPAGAIELLLIYWNLVYRGRLKLQCSVHAVDDESAVHQNKTLTRGFVVDHARSYPPSRFAAGCLFLRA